MIYYFTGQPHAGKTTLAKLLTKALEITNTTRNVFMIDGDDLREIMQNKDYSEAGRRKNIEVAQAMALYLNNQSFRNDVILSFVSPYKDLRDDLKQKANTVEIYVHTTEVRGREAFHVSDYQKPIGEYIDVDTTNNDELNCLNQICNEIKKFIK
jgi:adenylylsulfate kinase-like enzyme